MKSHKEHVKGLEIEERVRKERESSGIRASDGTSA
jgi:hypothetical protein